MIPFKFIHCIVDKNGQQIPYEDFQFNISHSGDFCVLAADNSTPKIGVDVMKIEYNGGMHRLSEFFRLMVRQFSDKEWTYIRNLESDYGKLSRFIRLWSLKESYVKAEGSGITFPLSKISFHCATELNSPDQKALFDSTVSINHECLADWQFEESMIDHKHHVSVAKIKHVNANLLDECQYQFKQLTIQDLLFENDNSFENLFSFDDEKYWTDFCRKT